ncbi:helix-turn-helix domain-containing protein [Baaleninema simplex]|uniref:helix-turn-helix domain-containing protein n=1 Tax=Baaleninema simplex TaxID=2862350 RepID=UPI00034B904A|nr:XRE family transcriptional regulator [Baaleninema simplex]
MKLSTDASNFVGERLLQARKARGLTMEQLAGKVSLKRQAISNYERGKRFPSSETKDIMATILDFPPSFFGKELILDRTKQETIFYRSMSSATKKSREKVEVELGWLVSLFDLLDLYLEMPSVRFPDFDIPQDPTRLSDRSIEAIAEKTRIFWGLKDGPISNVVWLLENHGAVVVRKSLYAEKLDAFSMWKDDRPYVILSSDKDSAARSRFDLGHELGHLILHKNLPEIYVNDSKYFKLIEHQANLFSAEFLFPQTSFAREVPRVNLELFRVLKKRWKLSIGMMLYKAKTLGFIDEQRYQTLQRSYTRHQWRQSEPFDDEIPIETPKLIRNSVEILLKNNVISREDILDYLGLYHSDAEICAGLPENFLNPRAGEVYSFRPKLRAGFSSENNNSDPGTVIHFENWGQQDR